jgi:hypothetical protein
MSYLEKALVLTQKLRMFKINLFNSMILFQKIVHGNCIKNVLVTHLYKYTIVSKNKFILNIRSFYYSLRDYRTMLPGGTS